MSGYSFNVFALSTITEMFTGLSGCGKIGQVVEPSIVANCIVGKSALAGNYIFTFTSISSVSNSVISHNYTRNDGRSDYGWTVQLSSGSECNGSINPETGVCEAPPELYCSSSEYLELKQTAQQQCFATGSQGFSATCDDETATHSFKCDPPPIDPDKCTPDSPDYPACLNPDPEPDPDPQPCNELSPDWPQCNEPPEPPECVPSQDNNWCDNPPCKIGFAGWPECEPWYNDDPTTPLDPLEPPTPDPIDPVPPRPVDPVNPQPPLQPGDPFNDSRVVGAIQNLNKDMNFGFSDINGALQLQTNVLSSTNELVYQGLLQDLKIHDNQIANDNKNTGNIMGGLGGIGESINGLGDAIGNIPVPVPYDDTGVIDAINKLGEKLDGGQACEPTSENNYCENNHGLNSEYISTMFSQLSDKMDTELSASSSSILSSVNDAVTSPPVDESTVKPFLDLGISLLTANDNCVPMDWFGYELSCEFSDRFKLIFGFALYMYTLSFLIDVLLTQVTPRKHDK